MAQNLINLAYSENCPNIFEENGSVIWQITLPDENIEYGYSTTFDVNTNGEYIPSEDAVSFQSFVQMLGLGDAFLNVLENMPSFVTLRVKTNPNPIEVSADFLLVKYAYNEDVNAIKNGNSMVRKFALRSLRPTRSDDYVSFFQEIPEVCVSLVVEGYEHPDGTAQWNIFFAIETPTEG